MGASDMSCRWHCVEIVSVQASVVSPGDGGDGGEGAFHIALWGLFIHSNFMMFGIAFQFRE